MPVFRPLARARCPLPDDQASLGSYHSDAHTLPGDPMDADADDARSVASTDSLASFDTYWHPDNLPCYRVSHKDGVSAPVYEAWILCHSPTSYEDVAWFKVCGVNLWTRQEVYDDAHVSCSTEAYDQHELSDMTLAAVDRHQRASKRSLPSRLIRGRPKSYEQALDEKIQKLPRLVQAELHALLADREAATSNPFRRRDWTVAAMREQYRYRFASTQYDEVKKSRAFLKRFSKRPTEYFFILRGAEGRVATDGNGIQKTSRGGNPWGRVDRADRRDMERERSIGRVGKDNLQHDTRPRRRPSAMAPPPPPPPPPELQRRVRLDGDRPGNCAPPNPFVPDAHAGRVCMPMPQQPPYFIPYAHGPPHPPPPPPFTPAFHPPVFPPPPSFANMMHFPSPSLPPMASDLDFDYRMARPPPMVSPGASRPSSVFGDSYDESPVLRPAARPTSLPDNFNMPPAVPFFPRSDLFNNPRQPSASTAPESVASHRRSPPPAPRLSNLTTPTTFSRATSNRTGSSIDHTEISTPPDDRGYAAVRAATSRPGSFSEPWDALDGPTPVMEDWRVDV